MVLPPDITMYAGSLDGMGQVTTSANAVCCRARLTAVCRRWRTVLTGTRAAVVWRKLCVDETAFGRGPSVHYGSLVRWCHARGRHMRELKIVLAKDSPHVRGSWHVFVVYEHAPQMLYACHP
jgi:hypothetical protein